MMQRRSMFGLTHAVLAMALIALPACGRKAPTPDAGPAGPTNVILLVADGAGFQTFNATSYYEHGQLGQQPYDAWPAQFGVITTAIGDDQLPMVYHADYAHDPMVILATSTDSAAAATTLYTGQKTLRRRIGMSADGMPLDSFATRAKAAGYRVGVVTTVEFSHATPASLAGHALDRDDYTNLARQMLTGDTLDVIIGCGHPGYDAAGNPAVDLPRDDYLYVGGQPVWDAIMTAEGFHGWTFIDTKAQFAALADGTATPPDRLLGVPRVYTTLQYNRPGTEMGSRNPDLPTLPTLALAALETLTRDGDSFALVIEAGAVDWANHGGNLGRAVEEQMEFNETVRTVQAWLAANNLTESTLVIVTSDHETGDLRGPFVEGDRRAPAIIPGDAGALPEHAYGSGGHTSRLVPLYATGPGSERFAAFIDGSDELLGDYIDNTDIFPVIMEALQLPASAPAEPAQVPATD